MIDFDYLYKGICGLANSHRAGTMAGHLGAAVVAGYFIGEDQSDLPAEVFRGVEGELDRIMAGEEGFWYNAKKAGITPEELFLPLEKSEKQSQSLKPIAIALSKNFSSLRQSGHNVIFASLGIRALNDHPEYATPAVVSGISKLMSGFQQTPPGRGYYGKETGWLSGHEVKLDEESDFPAYTSIQDMVATTIDELIATASIRKQGFGGLWHLINHAAGIVDLDQCGFSDVAQSALPGHHQHIRFWRSLPDMEQELGAVVRSERHPREPEYWRGMLKRDEARLTHRIKTIYGFYTIQRLLLDDAKRQRAEDAFLYLMA